MRLLACGLGVLVWGIAPLGCLPAAAQPLRCATLNCAWLMRPQTDGASGLRVDRPRDESEYAQKTANIAALLLRGDPEFAALQEIGDRAEVSDLAAAMGMAPIFVQGRDTATGQDVAAAMRNGRWQIQGAARVVYLDREISKHLAVTLRSDRGRVVHAIVLHLLRPIGLSRQKHMRQCAELARWLSYSVSVRPQEGFVVLGDLNSREQPPAPLGLRGWSDATCALRSHPPGGMLDRILVSPNMAVDGAALFDAGLPRGASDSLRRVWTDHPCLAATVRMRADPP